MKLTLSKRAVGKKGETKRIRREGHIPGVLYGAGVAVQPVYVNGDEIRTILRNMKSGLLSTTIFELSHENKKHKAILKDIQYHVTSYEVQHVDFVLLSDDVPVSVNVPIQILGLAECAGIKLGGFLRQVIRTMKVSCLPKHIPQEFTIDIRDLNIAQSKRLADIVLPEHVKPLAKMNEVAVVIAKKAGT